MCIAVFMWEAHPVYPFLLFLNRDEYHSSPTTLLGVSRPTEPLGWWEGGEILGGRDGEAGGTWLAFSRDGRLAFITNVRELQSIPRAKSRGHLPVRFLQISTSPCEALQDWKGQLKLVPSFFNCQSKDYMGSCLGELLGSKKKPIEFAEEVVKEANEYNGFNLILIDLCSKSMVYVTNRPKENGNFVTEVSPGIHVLSNASLNSPWPKAQRLGHSFKEVLARYGEDELPLKETVAELLMDRTKDDSSMLPGIFPPEVEYHLSSIYIDVSRPQGRYGTRNQSALSVKSNGEVCFHERYLEKDLWKEQTVTYQIEMAK
ncbi:Ser/Thr-rich protein T10 in DGCR region, putative isoform 1 [Theobroma cacao]|uniref:Ser/Thr-rich protein T10 in DGCR region, putative isoform 1 n=1 Tax=Theobroma cacao TaxID=3641 RepID=A0A061E3G6_THECC|nr:Ser/Thr-rich protein T10 in DGCR region, putative isoform 1 [Theobroma cacao]